MSELKFDAKIWKSGNSYVVTIPLAIIKNLDVDCEYDLTIEKKGDQQCKN